MIRAYDVDGVFADFNTAYRDLIWDEFEIPLPDISDTFPDKWDYAPLEPRQLDYINVVIAQGGFWATLPPLPECQEGLRKASEQQHRGDAVYFITARPGRWAKKLTEDWLERFGFRRPTVLISDQKGLICDGLNVELFVDDKVENCWDAAWSRQTRQVYLLDRPYNRTPPPAMEGMNPVIRITSILDVRVMPEVRYAA